MTTEIDQQRHPSKPRVASQEVILRSIIRVVQGFAICLHGAHKLFGVFTLGGRRGVPQMAIDIMPQGLGIVELVGGLLLIGGIFTRPAAAVLLTEMLAAYAFIAAPNGLYPIRNGGQEAALNSLLLLIFAVYGAGSISFDAMRREQSERTSKDQAILYSPVLSLVRIGIALLFIQHGLEKFFGFPTGREVHMVVFSQRWFAGSLELLGGLVIALGVFTRPAALLLSGEMAVAYFIAWVPIGGWLPINGSEEAVLFAFAFLWMAAAGAGPWSIDNLFTGRSLFPWPSSVRQN